MPQNLELKIKVNSHSKILNNLKKIKAKRIGILKQKDIYYKNNDGLLKLRIQPDKNELIKYTRDEKTSKRFSDYDILIIEGSSPEKFLADLFDIEVIVSKERELWMFNNTRIHLDKVKTLGSFIELETLVIKDKKDAEKRFVDIVNFLELDLSKQLRLSYRDLLLRKRK